MLLEILCPVGPGAREVGHHCFSQFPSSWSTLPLGGVLSKQARLSVPWHSLHPRPRGRRLGFSREDRPAGEKPRAKNSSSDSVTSAPLTNHSVWVSGFPFTKVHRDAEVSKPLSIPSSRQVFWFSRLRLTATSRLCPWALPSPRTRQLSSGEKLPASRRDKGAATGRGPRPEGADLHR